MSPAAYRAYRDTLAFTAEQEEYAKGPDNLLKAEAWIQKGLDLLVKDEVGFNRLVKERGGNLEEVVRWLDIPHSLRNAHLERRRGPRPRKGDLKAFGRQMAAACDKAGIDFPRINVARLKREDLHYSNPLGHQLLRWWVHRFFGEQRVKELDTMFDEL
jgi:hypothetical protein